MGASLAAGLWAATSLGAAEAAAPGARHGPGAGAPVTILAAGNRLLVSTDDPQAMAFVLELVRLLTRGPGGDGDFQIIKLKYAGAAEVARILDELYNDTPAPANPSNGQGGGPAASAPAAPRESRIRVVADPGSNSLLVRARPADLESIHRLLEKAIDAGKTDSSAVLRTWLLPPLKHARATAVAHVLRDVYHERMSPDLGPTAVDGAGEVGPSRAGGRQNRNGEVGGRPRPVALSLGVDDQTNRLVLVCSERLKDEVQELVEQLDAAARSTARTVKVVPVKGIDPLLVKQAIDAIQGRSTGPLRPTSGNGPAELGPSRSGPAGARPPLDSGGSPPAGDSWGPAGPPN
jgi:type II secretory pathway component GspD/PulD (secretin)